MTPHVTVSMRIGNEIVEIDKAIVELIDTINEIPGVQTQYCCRNSSGLGYVAFGRGENSSALFWSIRFQSRLIEHMNTELVASSAGGIDIASALFSAETMRIIPQGPQFCIRWNPKFYKTVLRAAKNAADDVRSLQRRMTAKAS